MALPGVPLWFSYTTSQVGCVTVTLVTATAKPAVCVLANTTLPLEPTVEPLRSTPAPAPVELPAVLPVLVELAVMLVELAVVEVWPPFLLVVMPQPMSAPMTTPATKMPAYVPMFEVESTVTVEAAGACLADAAGLAVPLAGFAAAGCDQDNVGFCCPPEFT